MKISKQLESFKEILLATNGDYQLELTARPHPDTQSHTASIAIEIKSIKDKEFALKLLEDICKRWAYQQSTKKG